MAHLRSIPRPCGWPSRYAGRAWLIRSRIAIGCPRCWRRSLMPPANISPKSTTNPPVARRPGRLLYGDSPAAFPTKGTGGSTPAALAADWLASALDNNAGLWISSPLGSRLEQLSVAWLKELFGLRADWAGVLTTGATMSNFTALAAARQWWGEEHGANIAERGWHGLPVVPVLASGFVD